jgi:hypothetical protein
MIGVLLLAQFFSCGLERREIKVLRDLPSGALAQVQRTTVERLANVPRPRRGGRGRAPIEHDVVEVYAAVFGYKTEADGDLHVILKGATGATLIAEFPSPACTFGSAYAREMQAARERFLRAALTPAPAGRRHQGLVWLRVTGVIFFDREHGQSGAARNGVELHPVLHVESAR